MADGVKNDVVAPWAEQTTGYHLEHLALHLVRYAFGVEPRINLRNAACRGVLMLAVYLRSARDDNDNVVPSMPS